MIEPTLFVYRATVQTSRPKITSNYNSIEILLVILRNRRKRGGFQSEIWQDGIQ